MSQFFKTLKKILLAIIKCIFYIDNQDANCLCIYFLFFKKKFKRKTPPNIYAGRQIISDNDANEIIGSMLQSKNPFMITRFGSSELCTLYYYIQNADKDDIKFPENKIGMLRDNAGFFSCSDLLVKKYCAGVANLVKNADIIATLWYDRKEEAMVKLTNSKLITTSSLFIPWLCEHNNPWVQYLEGKKVLIIHPFEDTIKSQYKNWGKLFSNSKMAPRIELLTLKTVQSIGVNPDELPFKDWFDALDYMYKQIDEKDFDVAIIAGGAYGMFLADYVKRKGKQAIHMCGQTQLLFGIKGARWDNIGIYNDYWVRPSDSEKPKNLNKFTVAESNMAYW